MLDRPLIDKMREQFNEVTELIAQPFDYWNQRSEIKKKVKLEVMNDPYKDCRSRNVSNIASPQVSPSHKMSGISLSQKGGFSPAHKGSNFMQVVTSNTIMQPIGPRIKLRTKLKKID